MGQQIRPGVFFKPAAELPRGQHSLSQTEVRAMQRERLMAAFTELVAERGYSRVRIVDIAGRAGVPLNAFYRSFSDKEACAFAGYDRFIEVLVERVAEGLDASGDWEEFTTVALNGYLATLQSDLVVARAYQLEMDAAGAESRSRRVEALGAFAAVLRASQEQMVERDPALNLQPLQVHLAIVYAVRQLACDMLDEEPEPDLLTLMDELRGWIVAAAYGPEHKPRE
jgi:AcrR family transcriptional regulator